MTAREIVFKVLQEVWRGRQFSNELLAEAFKANPLSRRDRNLATSLVNGCIKMRGRLDWVIEHCATRKIKKISPPLQDILRLGLYQLKYLDRVPAYAAVTESVELAKRHGPRGSDKFVNAVLRTAQVINEERCMPSRKRGISRYLSVTYSHPEWLVQRWLDRFGEKKTEELCRVNNGVPPLVVRVNRLRCSREGLLEQLRAEGVRCNVMEGHPCALVLEELPCPIHELDTFTQGLFQVQDTTGIRVAELLGAMPGEIIVDLCAAPGGKATAVAEVMEDRGIVHCIDVSRKKTALIEENARRLGLKSLRTTTGDARQVCDLLPAVTADRVLLDAPCSNTGVLRRRPGVRWRLGEHDLGRLAVLQGELLAAGAMVVKSGGILLYSTCSVEPEENSGVVSEFLSSHTHFCCKREEHFFPCEGGGDGGYAAQLKRAEI